MLFVGPCCTYGVCVWTTHATMCCWCLWVHAVLIMCAYDQHLCTTVCRCYVWVHAILMLCAYEQHTCTTVCRCYVWVHAILALYAHDYGNPFHGRTSRGCPIKDIMCVCVCILATVMHTFLCGSSRIEHITHVHKIDSWIYVQLLPLH